MALTQTATHAGPSWDEEVVPALRKRLQSESRSLARRISAVSVSSADEYPSPTLSTSTARQDQQSRPSIQSRTSSDHSRTYTKGRTAPAMDHHTASSSSSDHSRSRTYSQPRRPGARTPSPHMSNYRPATAATKSSIALANTSPKPTRIPMRARASSTVTRSPSAAPYADALPSIHQEQRYPPSPQAHLLREPPPFNPASSTSSIGHPETPPGQRHHPYLPDEPPPRASTESEERPYEHWYRGDVSRNGGVGELKVGRRQEMLDIANYGHAMRMKEDERQRRLAALDDSRSGSVVGFVGERDRGSIYIDDDDRYEQENGVLEEHPLTDMDDQEATEDDREVTEDDREVTEEDDDDDDHTTVQHYGHAPADISTASAPGRFSRSEDRSETPTRTPTPSQGRALNGSASRKSPAPTKTPTPRANGKSPSAPAKSAPAKSASATKSAPAKSPSASAKSPSASAKSHPTPSRIAQKPRAGSEPPQSSTPKPQKTVKSASAASRRGPPPSVTKRGPPPSATKRKQKAPTSRREKEEDRRSIAHYPSISADEDAIPVWTQPKKAGNWDEVVLPAVARKKGLNEHYEQADGSPKPVQTRTEPAPAPGTFGFDHTKYRPPRDGEEIPMDEFGRPIQQEDEQRRPSRDSRRSRHAPSDEQPRKQYWNAHDETQLPVRPPQPPSPAPFAHYMEEPSDERLPPLAPPLEKPQQRVEDDDGGSGCCKCVVM